MRWYNGVYMRTGAKGTEIGTGEMNTSIIVEKQGEGEYAAQLCYDLSLGGKSDWFLPSKNELNQMYENLASKGTGGFANFYYWSSSEYHESYSWYQHFGHYYQDYGGKNFGSFYVRCIRAF